MDAIYDVLLNPYHITDEDGETALDPQEIKALKNKKRNHETKRNLRSNVPQ